MAITRERFNQGMTVQQFKESMTQNRDRLEGYESKVELRPEDVQAVRDLPEPVDVLVIAADWCYDVLTVMPVLIRLAEASGKLNLRVFERDQNPDIMAEYMNGPYKSIPVFVFFDRDFNEIGRFIERPKSVTERREELRREIYRKNPEFGSPDTPPDQLPEDVRARLSQAIRAMREETIPWANQEVVRDLLQILQGKAKVLGNLAYDPSAAASR